MNNEIDRLGKVIKDTRIEKHMTQSQLSKRLNISLRHLIAIENEKRRPSYELLFAIIQELAIPADTIFHPELGYDHAEMEKLKLLLAQCDEKEVKALTVALQTLVEKKER
jgi:transcriptional regulator with XRE-family HTH domain